jgi:formylglycine-generating enzyme required for sulfatase activity
MSAGEPGGSGRSMSAGDRRPLEPGARIGDALLVLRVAGVGPAGYAYEGLRLVDQSNVAIVECCPAGLAMRAEGGAVAAVYGWEAEFSAWQVRFETRLATLRGIGGSTIESPEELLRASGTLVAAQATSEGAGLDAWSAELLRRPSADDAVAIAGRIARALSAAHAAGLGHGAVEARAIRLSRPGDARLGGFMLGDADQSVALQDAQGLAGVLYGIVTGRAAPPVDRDRRLDARHAAAHIAAGDYPDGLLAAIDAALGLDGVAEPIAPDRWLASLAAMSSGSAATVLAPAPVKAPPVAASPAPVADSLVAAPAPAKRSMFPVLAATVVVLLGAAGWLASNLLRQGPAATNAAPRSAAQVAARPAAAPPPATATHPPPAPAATRPVATPPASAIPTPPPQVASASPPATPPAADPPPAAPSLSLSPAAPPADPAAELAAQVEAAGTRETLLALAGIGADPARVEERFAALGYIGLPAGSAKAFRKPGDGESLRDCSECPELLLVPAGRVSMKLTIANVRRDFAIDLPRAFTIGRYEVTRGQFAAFVADSRRRIEPGCHLRAPAWRLDAGLSWQNPGFAQTDEHPVVCVSFEDAQAYVAWLSRKTGQRYRLPTDAEWHYLAVAEDWDRAGADQLCVIGNGADRSAMAANPQWSGTACSDGYIGTAPVGRFARSLWGLHDLNGNAWEWVSTCAPEPRPDAVFPAPSCAPSASRILRGGSFADAPSMRLLDARIVSPPAIRDQVAGFRVLRE